MKSLNVLYFVFRFTPDFTASRVIRELKLITTGGSEFIFILNASLPYHMLATCAEALPRPNWELALYVIISGIMRYCVYLSSYVCTNYHCLTTAYREVCMYSVHAVTGVK